MSAAATSMAMMIWTMWVPEPPRMPATIAAARDAMGMVCARSRSVPSPIVGTSDALYPSNHTSGWDLTAATRRSPSGRAGDEPLAIEQRHDDAKQNDVSHQEDQREHYRERQARREHVEGH